MSIGMNDKELKIAVVGAGGMGTVHISNYAHIPGCKVVAVCDAAETARLKAGEIGAALYNDLDEMPAREEIDVVDVCTPTWLHKKHVMTALEAGRHVICEKPAALCKRDAAEMFGLAREKGLQLHIAHVVQYAPETKVLRELVESGEYGRVLDGEFLRLSGAPRWARDGWLFDKDRSGLLPFDLHIHDLDLIVSLFGEPETVGWTSCGNKDAEYKEHYRFSYGYKDMNIVAEAAWYNADFPFTATWRVYFEKAVVVNNGKTVTAYSSGHEPRVFDTEEKIKIPTGINVPPTGIFLAELSDFVGKIRRGGSGDNRERCILSVLGILEKIQ